MPVWTARCRRFWASGRNIRNERVPKRVQLFDPWLHILDYVKKKIEKMDRDGALAVGVLSATQAPRAALEKVTVSAIAKSRIITLY